MQLKLTVACAMACVASGATPAAASAAPDDSARLNCGRAGSYTVTGFGRGNALTLTSGTGKFVIVYAQNRDTGEILMDASGRRNDDDILACSVTSPVTGTRLLLEGFLSP